jgi:hypothetical protein
MFSDKYNTERTVLDVFSGLIMRVLPLFVLTVALQACDTEIENVGIDEVHWSAFRNPESFDAYLDTKTLDPRTSNCFLQHSNLAFAQADAKLLECSVILMYSPAWNQCHEEAEELENRGVLMKDIAGAVDGAIRFDETSAYALLIITKSFLTEIDWNAFVDLLDEAAPPFYCEYEGEEQWFWE